MGTQDTTLLDLKHRAAALHDSGKRYEAIDLLGAEVNRRMKDDFPSDGSVAEGDLCSVLRAYWWYLDEDGHSEQALRLAEEVFERYGRLAQQLRMSLTEAGRYEDAERTFINGPESYEDLLVGLGYDALENGHYDIACLYFARRLAFRERDIDFRHTLNYGAALLLANRTDELRLLMIYLLDDKRIRPASFRCLASVLLALAYLNSGRDDQAAEIITALCGSRAAEKSIVSLRVDLLYSEVSSMAEEMLRRFLP